jgi:hypothetical protein
MTIRTVLAVAILAAVPAAHAAHAQSHVVAPASERGVYLTVFRSPATGVELRAGRLAVHAGHYPTILRADGQRDGENTNFVRLGGSLSLRSRGWSPYVAPALLVSLDGDWDSGVLSELGVRLPVAGRLAFRAGVAVLTTFGGEARVNPTIGLDLNLGSAR